MSTTDTENTGIDEVAENGAEKSQEQQEEQQKLSLEVTIAEPSTCERHVTVVVSREDIDRYIDKEFQELLPKAEVPGFRPGKAPQKLVRSRFKDHIKDQVKGKLLMDSMTQVSDEHEFSAISEPDLKFEAVDMPDDGPLTFEFDIEVRPEFELPQWKGLTIDEPEISVTDEDVNKQLDKLLARFGELSNSSDPAVAGDFLTLNLRFSLDGRELSRVDDVTVALKPKLSFRDATFEGFGELMTGARVGDKKTGKVKLSEFLEEEELASQEVDAEFEVVNVQKLKLPKLTSAFLDEIGGFTDDDELKDAVREELERQAKYRQQQDIRAQITKSLTATAVWDLPPTLLKRQAKRELQRMVLELQSSGFSNDVIQAHANQLQQNSMTYTATALKEHFILERIAEDHDIDAEPDDYDKEIELIAEQNGLPPRRVRARLEKRNEMDSLRNQIVERKVIELIKEHATLRKTKFKSLEDDLTALDLAICGRAKKSEIPEATNADESKPLSQGGQRG